MKDTRKLIYQFIDRYEKLLFLLLFTIAIIFLLVSYLLTNSFNVKTVIAWILNEVGLGIITSVIVIMSYEQFLHIKTSLFTFPDKLQITLAERFPRTLSENLSRILDKLALSEDYREIDITLDKAPDLKDVYFAKIETRYKIINYTDDFQLIQFGYSSHNLDIKEPIAYKLRDGIYSINDISISINGVPLLNTTCYETNQKLDIIQSFNDKEDENYKQDYDFLKKIKVPPKGNAEFYIWSRRLIPIHNGVISFFPLLPCNELIIRIASTSREFLENLSYSFNVTTVGDNCKVTSIEKTQNNLFNRSYLIKDGLFAYQGIKLRWN